MNKKRIFLGAACALVLVAGAAASLPASWLDLALARASGGNWRLNQARGTLWNGEGQPVFVDQQGVLAMSRLAWRWQPAALKGGELAWSLDGNGRSGRVSVSVKGWALEGLSFTLPVAALAEHSSTWKAARLGGELQLDVDRLAGRGGQLEGGVRVSWNGAASPLSRVQPFGSYALDAVAEGNAIALRMGTLAGPLMINGSGRWQPGGAFLLEGTAESDAKHYEALKPLLLMLGRPVGEHAVQWSSRPPS